VRGGKVRFEVRRRAEAPQISFTRCGNQPRRVRAETRGPWPVTENVADKDNFPQGCTEYLHSGVE
jgi:hypothetical protein